MSITREQLLTILRDLTEETSPESAHSDADRALLAYIDDPEVTEAYDSLEKWYA